MHPLVPGGGDDLIGVSHAALLISLQLLGVAPAAPSLHAVSPVTIPIVRLRCKNTAPYMPVTAGASCFQVRPTGAWCPVRT